jgi:uncharacterized protein YggE
MRKRLGRGQLLPVVTILTALALMSARRGAMRKLSMRGKVLAAMAGVSIVALVAAGCGNGNDNDNVDTVGLMTSQIEGLARSAEGLGIGGFTQSTGLHITGTAQATAEPDLAVLSLGAEAFADNVAEARGTVADAMNGVVAVLRAQGVAERDIQTNSFSIQPEYTYEEVMTTVPSKSTRSDEDLNILSQVISKMEAEVEPLTTTVRRTERVLIGYRVNNTLTVKVRDLDNIGTIIDDTAEAGGNATRVNSIRFTLDDPGELAEQARTLAIQNALAKAQQFANVAGFTLGKLQFITESGGQVFNSGLIRAAEAFDSGSSISPGELDVSATVQAVWAID